MSHHALFRSLLRAAALLLVIFLLAACSTVQPTAAPVDAGAAAASVTPKSGGVLIAARAADAKGLDPHVQTAFTSFRALEHIYEPLLRLDADMNVVPGLAESWSWSEDGKTLTMALRKGVTFHDGTPMTADDVKFTFERILNEETGAAARSFFTAIESIETPDDATVVFTLSAPNAAILAAMTNPNSGILSKSWVEGGADPTTGTNGTGPFKLASWEPDNIMMLEANRAYWEAGLPRLDGIEFRTIPDESSILAALRSGDVDWAIINDPRVGMTAATTNLTVMRSPALAYHVLQLNASRPQFADQRVRLAISCAIDRQQVLDTASLGEGEVTSPATPPNYRAPLDQLECYTPDIARAKQLLADAGVSDLEFTVIAAADEPPTAVSEAQNIQAQLEAIGVKMNIETLELGVYVDRWLKGDFDAAVALNGGNPDPDNMFFRYWHSTGNLNKVANYSSPELDALLEEARSTTDIAKRQELYLQIQKMLAEAAPWVWLYVGYEYRVMQPDVLGYTPLSNGSTVYLRETYLNR
ncbi:MAG TPA: ABC transporter substrate-binding protein [Chloroflexi bacterium]|nr:ABC transporter substrate-binding protein [Chloroflexota bacterium]HHW87621.1 ABC transporter substrate-binding protein [Chloroflexota bacterium]